MYGKKYNNQKQKTIQNNTRQKWNKKKERKKTKQNRVSVHLFFSAAAAAHIVVVQTCRLPNRPKNIKHKRPTTSSSSSSSSSRFISNKTKSSTMMDCHSELQLTLASGSHSQLEPACIRCSIQHVQKEKEEKMESSRVLFIIILSVVGVLGCCCFGAVPSSSSCSRAAEGRQVVLHCPDMSQARLWVTSLVGVTLL